MVKHRRQGYVFEWSLCQLLISLVLIIIGSVSNHGSTYPDSIQIPAFLTDIFKYRQAAFHILSNAIKQPSKHRKSPSNTVKYRHLGWHLTDFDTDELPWVEIGGSASCFVIYLLKSTPAPGRGLGNQRLMSLEPRITFQVWPLKRAAKHGRCLWCIRVLDELAVAKHSAGTLAALVQPHRCCWS